MFTPHEFIIFGLGFLAGAVVYAITSLCVYEIERREKEIEHGTSTDNDPASGDSTYHDRIY